MTARAHAPPVVAGVDDIRARFPALRRRHGGEPVAYLDGPGGTQVPASVVERMTDYLYAHNANTHWRYPTSEETDALILEARRAFADFFHAEPEEVAFGANMTTLTFHLARALGRDLGPRDEIVVTELDHHANVAPWQAVERERGAKVVVARMRPEDGCLDLDDLTEKINPRTKIVAVGAASNALGTIVDVARVARLARAAGAQVFVDAVHYAPHALVDVRLLDCDWLACSAYKFYGPHVGVLWGRRKLIEALDAPKLAPAPAEAPEKLETGTQNHEGIVGAAAAVDFLASLAAREGRSRRDALALTFQELHARGNALFEQLWNGLGAIRTVKRYGLPPGQSRTPTLAFRVDGRSCDDVAAALAARGLFVSHGDFYAATVVDRLRVGSDGLVRVGCSAYTTAAEIDRVIRTIAEG